LGRAKRRCAALQNMQDTQRVTASAMCLSTAAACTRPINEVHMSRHTRGSTGALPQFSRIHSCTAHLSLPTAGVCQGLLPVDWRRRCFAPLPLLLNLLLLPGLPPAADGVSGAAGAAGAAGCGGSGSTKNLASAAAAAALTAAILSYLASSSTCRPCTPSISLCKELSDGQSRASR
jgi:hypothetical protein